MEKTKTTTKTKYQPMTDEDLDKMTPGQYFGDAIVTYPNPDKPTSTITSKLSIYDGIAYGTARVKGKDREIVATYPLLKFINTTAKTMKNKIREVLNIEEERDVTPVEIFQTYSTIKFV